MRSAILAVTLAALLGACDGREPSPTRLPPEALRPLPTLGAAPLPSDVLRGCGGIALPARLHGDPGAARVAWLSGFEDGRRTDIAWPDGYRARFTPRLEVVDPTGAVVLQAGDFIDGACFAGGTAMLVQPPFLGLVLNCGPLRIDTCTGSRVHSAARAAGWPERDIDTLTFTSSEVDVVVRFEDGTTLALRASAN